MMIDDTAPAPTASADPTAELESKLHRATHSIHEIKRLLELAQAGTSMEDLLIIGMEIAVSVTHSDGGYLHFFDENENVIDLNTWSKRVHEYCDVEAATHYPIELAGIWADCARKRRTVVHNDYLSIPDSVKGGLPEGHFPLYRHMSVPVFNLGKLVAIVGVGNKAEPYDQADVQQLELMMSCLWSVLEQRKAAEILQRYSYEDGITGTANRRRFDEHITAEWNRLRRQGDRPLTLIMADIDHFKAYNDSCGHAQGDQVLKKVGRSLQESFRRTGELVCRYGGEEFAIIIPYVSPDKARQSAELARLALEEARIPFAASPLTDHITMSMGVATMIPEDDNIGRIIDRADHNLYQAKRAGRNRVVAG